jgi:hypothetical protein
MRNSQTRGSLRQATLPFWCVFLPKRRRRQFRCWYGASEANNEGTLEGASANFGNVGKWWCREKEQK